MPGDRRKDILTAAAKCFARYGFEKTTLDDIGEAVGMNKVSLYHYFDNKEAMFREVFLKEADEFSASLKEKVETVKGCREKILAWIREGFTFNSRNGVLGQISMDTLKRMTPMLDEMKQGAMRRGADYIASVLSDGKSSREIAACDVKRVAWTIQSVMYSMKDSAMLRARRAVSR